MPRYFVHDWGRGGNPPGPLCRVGGARQRLLDLTTDKDRLASYFDKLTGDPEKRAEFRDALAEVDHDFATRVLRMVPEICSRNLND